MKTIHKYKLEVTDSQTIKLPHDAKFLTIDLQHSVPYMWAVVDPNLDTVEVEILTSGTGQEIDTNDLTYLGTYQLLSGDLVYHIFSKF